MNRLQVTFTFGVEYRGDSDAILLYERDIGLAEIRRRAVQLFGGYTKFDTEGSPHDAIFTEEAGCVISVFTDLPPVLVTERVNAMVQQIKDSLQQSAVAVTKTECQFEIL